MVCFLAHFVWKTCRTFPKRVGFEWTVDAIGMLMDDAADCFAWAS